VETLRYTQGDMILFILEVRHSLDVIKDIERTIRAIMQACFAKELHCGRNSMHVISHSRIWRST
jgi:hypothetical protein